MMLSDKQMQNCKSSSCLKSCNLIGVGEVTGELLSVSGAPGLPALLSQAGDHLRQATDFIKGQERALPKALPLVRTEL